jgi:hypothetical protein
MLTDTDCAAADRGSCVLGVASSQPRGAHLLALATLLRSGRALDASRPNPRTFLEMDAPIFSRARTDSEEQ